MKNLTALLLISLLLSLSVTAQDAIKLQVQYLYTNNGSSDLWNLSICDTRSFYKNIPGSEQSANQNQVIAPLTGKYFFVKDRKQQYVFYYERINGRHLFVKDSLNRMKWNLGKDEKLILGYKCLSATTSFRGRNWVAYYASDISIPEGPFKFGGLPGLILEVKSNDQEFSYSANKVTYGVGECENENYRQVVQSNYISFSEYKKIFVSEMDLKIKKMKSSDSENDKGYPTFLKWHIPEIIYPALQTGQGIKF